MKQNNPWKHVEVDYGKLETNRFVHPERKPTLPEEDLEGKVEEKDDEVSVPGGNVSVYQNKSSPIGDGRFKLPDGTEVEGDGASFYIIKDGKRVSGWYHIIKPIKNGYLAQRGASLHKLDKNGKFIKSVEGDAFNSGQEMDEFFRQLVKL